MTRTSEPRDDISAEEQRSHHEIDKTYLKEQDDDEKQPLIEGKSADLDKNDPILKKESKEILWIKVKKETTFANLMSLFVAPALAITAGSYLNTQMPYLLQDPDYFDIPFEEVGTTTGSILFVGSFISTLATPFLGYAYDIVGRFWLLIPTFFLLAIQLAIIPLSAPHIWMLMIFRASMSLLGRVVLVKPLLIDYVKSESRGFAMTLQAYGFVFGELIMVSLFSMTRGMTMEQQYWVPAAIIATLSFSMIWLVREPTIKQHILTEQGRVDEAVDQNQPFWDKLKRLSSEAWVECKSRPKYVFCFVCICISRLMNILFGVYIQLWVMSFQKQGIIESKEESDAIYRNIVLVIQLCVVLTIPIFGYLSDKVDLRVVIPFAFASRGIVAASFKSIENPNDWDAYVRCVLLVITSVMQFLAVEVMFIRNMRSTIRGTMTGIAFFFGSVGTTTFVMVGGILFDKVGPWAPFMLVGVTDGVIIIFIMIYLGLGLIKRDD